MSDYISREDALKILDTIPTIGEQVDALEMAIEALQERKTGTWRHYENNLTCSECGDVFYDDIMDYCGDEVPHYCPNCGAKMEG